METKFTQRAFLRIMYCRYYFRFRYWDGVLVNLNRLNLRSWDYLDSFVLCLESSNPALLSRPVVVVLVPTLLAAEPIRLKSIIAVLVLGVTDHAFACLWDLTFLGWTMSLLRFLGFGRSRSRFFFINDRSIVMMTVALGLALC